MDKILVSTRLDGKTHNALKEIADRQERTVAFLLRKAAEQFIEAVSKEKRPARSAAA